MKFLLPKDLNLILDEELVNQITCDNDELLNQAEAKAIEEVHQWLSPRYDTDFELRPYEDYNVNNDYEDLTRLRVAQSDSNDAFATQFGMSLISTGLISGITNEFILAKKVNACELPFVLNCDSKLKNDLINYYYLDSTFGPSLNNPDTTFTATNVSYSNTCGEMSYSATTDDSTITQEDYDTLLSGGTYTGVTLEEKIINFGGKLNYYNTVYGITATTVLDYNQENLVNGLAPDNFIDNIDFFDQYLAENEVRDFADDDRNETLIDIVASITLYQLCRRVAPRLLDETIMDNYDLSLKKLEDARKGIITLRLKEKLCTPEKQIGFGPRFGLNSNSIRNKY